MITSYTLNNDTWTAISGSEQSGMCWLTSGHSAIVDHSDIGGSDCSESRAHLIFQPTHNLDVLGFSPDNMLDIVYAKARTQTPVVIAVETY